MCRLKAEHWKLFVGSGSHVLQLLRATISASECQKQFFLFPQNTGPCEKNTIWVLKWELNLNITFSTYFFSFLQPSFIVLLIFTGNVCVLQNSVCMSSLVTSDRCRRAIIPHSSGPVLRQHVGQFIQPVNRWATLQFYALSLPLHTLYRFVWLNLYIKLCGWLLSIPQWPPFSPLVS